jgi:GTP pyrophosphokinase
LTEEYGPALIDVVPQAESIDDVYIALGEGLVTQERIRRVIEPAPRQRTALKVATGSQKVRIQGASGVRSRMARCCKPTPPMRIAGYVTVGHGITIHARSCRQITEGQSQRIVSATWQ